MANYLPNTQQHADKDQINRILDIEPDVDPKHGSKQTLVILNGEIYEVAADMQNEQCLELIKLKTLARKRNLSGEKEEVEIEKPLYGKKEVVCIDRQEGDSLQKLALTFNCTIAEIKLANKIYNEQEFHALRIVKIPVIKDGSLYDQYTKANKENKSESKTESEEEKGALGFVADVESKYKFSVQKPHVIDPHLNYVSGEEDDDFDDFDDKDSESTHLLVDRTILTNRVYSGYPVNICESTLPEFMNKMDETIKKNIKDADYQKENIEVVTSLDDQVMFPMSVKEVPEEYGSVCSLTWKHFVLIICMIAVIIPTVYIIHYVHKKARLGGEH